jgi:hypothetical protein
MEGAEPPEYSDFLDQLFSGDIERWQKAGIHVDDWAWESHDIAESFVYGELAPSVPLESPAPVQSCTDDNNIGERMLQMHFYAGQNYQEISGPVVQERIELAGIRLAMILNDAASSLKPAN